MAEQQLHSPNRVVERDAGGEREWAPLCSVELGETAKGELNIKSVKVYASSVEEAGAAALAEYHRLRGMLGGA